MKSKAMELSINVIVIAVIALLVLVVVIAIFAGQMGGFTTGVKDCTSKGGDCIQDTDCSPGQIEFFGKAVCSEGEICCINPMG